jgi:hypothetical protein
MTKQTLKHLALFLAGWGLALSGSVSLAHAQLTQLYAFQYNANTISNYPDGQSPIAHQGDDK